jgi:hypothetical protein
MPNIPATWYGQDSKSNPLQFDAGLTCDSLISTTPTIPTKMPLLHVLTGFERLTDHGLGDLASEVSTGLCAATVAYPAPTADHSALSSQVMRSQLSGLNDRIATIPAGPQGSQDPQGDDGTNVASRSGRATAGPSRP